MKRKILGGAGAALAAKLAVGAALAAFAMAGATAATEISSTGSLNPADWGQQVKSQVDACKDTLRASGVRGIGECVSDFAQQHGKLVSGHASGARDNDKGHGNANGQTKDKDNGHGKSRK